MAETITKSPIGQEDLSLDTEGGGATQGTFNRVTSTGGLASRTDLSAASFPVLDAPAITGARTPWQLETEVAAGHSFQGRTVEECLRQARMNMRDMKNFEHYGGIPGTGTTLATQENNVKVWQKIMDEILLESGATGRINGIYFPGGSYEFCEHPVASGEYANSVLPFENSSGTKVNNVNLVGAPGTTLIAGSQAPDAVPFFYLIDVSSIYFDDLKLQHKSSATDRVVTISGDTASQSRFYFNRCTFDQGLQHLWGEVTTPASQRLQYVWVRDCLFLDISAGASKSVVFNDTDNVNYLDNVTTGSTTGFGFYSTGTFAGGSLNVVNNRFTNGSVRSPITVSALGSFSGAVHNRINIKNNSISFGDIEILDMVLTDIDGNVCFNGGISTILNCAGGSARGLRIRNNNTQGSLTGTTDGIYVGSTNTNFRRMWISDNDVYNTQQNGIHVNISGAGPGKLYSAYIQGNNILDVNQAGGAFSGIYLNGTATAGTQRSIVAHNRIGTSAGGTVPEYGILEENVAGNDFNFFIYNLVRGWNTGAISFRSAANSADFGTTIDLGGAA